MIVSGRNWIVVLIILLSCCWSRYPAGAAQINMAKAAASYPELVFLQGKQQMNVALTFDDGPDSYYTPAILDILKEKKIPATFFVVGYKAKEHPEVIKRIVNEGHCLANHTWNHPDLSRLNSQAIDNQITITDNLLIAITGVHTNLFRPPYGAMSNNVLNKAKELGYKLVLWSVDPQDWRGYSQETIVQKVMGAVKPGGIVLLHCGYSGSLNGLRTIIDSLRDQGYNLVTVPQLLGMEVREPIRLVVNGQEIINIASPPYRNEDGTSMVPLELVLQLTGFQGTFKVNGKQVTIYPKEKESTPVTIPQEPAPDTNAIMIPARSLAQIFGLEISWQEETKTVTLDQHQSIEPPPLSTSGAINNITISKYPFGVSIGYASTSIDQNNYAKDMDLLYLDKKQLGGWMFVKSIFKKTAILTVVVLLLAFGVSWHIKKVGQENTITLNDDYKAQTAIVLGAYVSPEGQLCDMLKDRLDTAVELYQKGMVDKLLLTGDHGKASYDEVNHMRQYAEQLGVPTKDIFMDHAGFNTYDSMYRSRDVFKVESAIIVTQEFHLSRAIFIARTMGIEAKGVKADKHIYPGEDYYEAREVLARNKDFVNVNLLKPEPKFLGPTIAITGDGRQTHDQK